MRPDSIFQPKASFSNLVRVRLPKLCSSVVAGRGYSYNADNQLAGVKNRDYDVTFTYDYMGRRVEEKVVRRTDTVTVQERRYAYHGWHVVARYTVASSTVTNDAGYAWGMDDSGSYGGAGGIGGLLDVEGRARHVRTAVRRPR